MSQPALNLGALLYVPDDSVGQAAPTLPPSGRFASPCDPSWPAPKAPGFRELCGAIAPDPARGEPTVAREEEPGLVVIRTESGRFLASMPTDDFMTLRARLKGKGQ